MIDTQNLKLKLEEELAELETELKSVGKKSSTNPKDWEAKMADVTPDIADDMEVADAIDEFEENTAILKQLEIRYNEVKNAIERIATGKFGVCKVCNEPIEEARLNANPAALTCIKHKEN
jgi:RNA polymerase-binding transcription factor DksA